MRKRKTERGGGFGSDKDRARHNAQERKLRRRRRRGRKNRLFPQREDFFPSCFSLQTDAKADGGELAENGRRRNETVY